MERISQCIIFHSARVVSVPGQKAGKVRTRKENIDILYSIDNGRFKDLVDTMVICDTCFNCGFFNLSLEGDSNSLYRCKVPPTCIGGTLSRGVIKYLNIKLGFIPGAGGEGNGRDGA